MICFGLETILGNDKNVILTEGLVLQENMKRIFGKDVISQNHSCELYFEEKNLEGEDGRCLKC